MSFLDTLVAAQAKNTHDARAITEKIREEGRTAPTVEERTALDALDSEFEERAGFIDSERKREARAVEIDEAREKAPETRQERKPDEKSPAEILRAMARGEVREHTFDTRAGNTQGTTTDGGYAVAQGFGGEVIKKMLTVGPLLDPSIVRLIRTPDTRDIPFPIENARATGTATAEATALGTSVPTFTQKTLKAYKYTAYVAASVELMLSEDVDLESYFADNMGVALGTAVNSILTLGTGTVQPEGIINGGSGVTGGTGVSGVPTYANLVDLVHSVDTLYAASPKAGFQMKRATLGKVRQIQDGNGTYIFVPAANSNMPNTVLGYPVFENPYVAATGTTNKSVWFGDHNYFVVRQVGGVTIDRNDTVGWGSDLIYFKARVWVDSFVGQSEAIKYFAGGTA